jgi:hypothetical protein
MENTLIIIGELAIIIGLGVLLLVRNKKKEDEVLEECSELDHLWNKKE